MVLTGGGPEDLNWKVATNQTYTGRYTVQFMRKRRRNRLKSHLFVNSNIFTGHPRHLQTSILFVPLTHTHSTNSWNLSGGEVTVFFFFFLYFQTKADRPQLRFTDERDEAAAFGGYSSQFLDPIQPKWRSAAGMKERCVSSFSCYCCLCDRIE